MLRTIAALFSFATLVAAPAAQAQTFPAPGRSIIIVVGFAPGGGHDVMGRALAQELTKELGVTVLVENRPGAGGAISVQAVARAEPDGHTLLFNSLSELAVRQAATKVPYDIDRDLVPISLVGVTPIALVVHNSVPVKNLAEFKAFVASRGEELIYGSPGIGTLMHFAGEALRVKLGVNLKHAAYRGAAPLANDLAGGHVLVGMSGLPPLLPLIDNGAVHLVATSSIERSEFTPKIESFGEAGIGGVDIANYVGLAAPKGTPQAILDKLEAATVAAAKSAELKATFKRNSSSVIGTTAAGYRDFIAKERVRQLELIRATDFKITE